MVLSIKYLLYKHEDAQEKLAGGDGMPVILRPVKQRQVMPGSSLDSLCGRISEFTHWIASAQNQGAHSLDNQYSKSGELTDWMAIAGESVSSLIG